MTDTAKPPKRKFLVELIKPSHYDADGYVIQWAKAWIPSNSLACLYGITQKLAADKVLGEDVEIVINPCDEVNTVVPIKRIIRRLKRNHGDGLVCLVGVQSNQYPRAMDIAQHFRAAGLQVAVGGFHVSGCISMLKELPDDIQASVDQGISIFAGEAEEYFDQVLIDAYNKQLKPIYNVMADLPSLQDQVTPFLPARFVRKYDGSNSSFDAGRGCPFQCSFCTIINVQGRKSRYRSADDIERLVRANLAQGIHRFFITDDNFARNKNWEAIFDRLIELRQNEGIYLSFLIQVDTLCHQIPNFVAKARRAGCLRVFIGLENINPENLLAVKKNQNRITEYRTMFQMWRDEGIITYAGFILGFPGDTPDTIRRDIRIIQKELPVDLLAFTILTPLPGSEDHQKLYEKGVWMDPDMNIYDLEHVCTAHPVMSAEVWDAIYRESWNIYFSPEHVETLLRRAVASGIDPYKIMLHVLQIHGAMSVEKVHPQQCGYFRRKVWRQRRPTLARENPLAFFPRRVWETIRNYGGIGLYAWRLNRLRKRIQSDPEARNYTDLALTPVEVAEDEALEMFELKDSTRAAVAKAKTQAAARAKAAARKEARIVAAE